MDPQEKIDEHWMARCLKLARQGAGAVSPNPMVGAVLVGADGALLGEGYHVRFGGPHAEPLAIAEVENRYGPERLRDATLYVNLEPCDHFGKTPPCTRLIIDKMIPRVVIGMEDPFPQVAGKGIARLREHGVSVRVGVLEKACRRLNEAFVHHVITGRPLVTLKTAQTLDGRIATRTGDSRWVSGDEARRLVHTWRAELDAVMVGSRTASLDDPELTVRHVAGRQPLRIVLDREGTLPPGLKLLTDEHVPKTLVVTSDSARPAYEASFRDAGGNLLRLPTQEGHLDLLQLLERLGTDGGTGSLPVQSILLEAGPSLGTAFLRQKLVDRYFAFMAPKILGDGVPVFGDLGVEKMSDALVFAESTWETVGEDVLFRGYRHPV